MANIDDEEAEETKRPLMLFNRDVSKIPCFRESFLNGIFGGAVIGVGTFLKSSQPRKSCNAAFGSYVLITLFYWTYCRYSWSNEKFRVAQIQEGMRRNALYQGTDKERQIRAEFEKELDAKEA